MLYMPAATLAAPVAFTGATISPVPSNARYYMLQPTGVVPTVPVLSSALVYPKYGLLTQAVDTSAKKDETNKNQLYAAAPPVQHVIHHYFQHDSPETCPGFDENTYPWTEYMDEPRPRTPPVYDEPPPPPQRYSRRDHYERRRSPSPQPGKREESLDERIERIRRELSESWVNKNDQSTETADYYHPPRPSTPPATYKQHYDAPKPRSRSRSRSRPRSASLPRTPSLPREPWRSTNQNDYPWRDAHLPAYREATLARSQTPTNQSRTWKEPVDPTYYSSGDDTTTRSSHYVSTPYYEKYQSSSYDHSFYSDIPSGSTSYSMKPVDSTRHHKLYSSNDNALHIVPKDGSTLDPPYLKILNAPVTYLH